MNKIMGFMLLLSVVFLSSCSTISTDELKDEIKTELTAELTASLTEQLTVEIKEDLKNEIDIAELLNQQVNDVITEVLEYVVYIEVEKETSTSFGSGLLYHQDGNKYRIVTNEHVIKYADKIEVYIPVIDRYILATVIKSDSELDIAILEIQSEISFNVYDLSTIEYQVGEVVIAIGTPISKDYLNTATLGIISRVETEYIQHDAAINTGNSGGPLFNLYGELIGLNVSKINSVYIDESKVSIQGVGFAIPIVILTDFLND